MTQGAFRFGTNAAPGLELAIWRDTVHRIEDLGFWSVSVPDHLSPAHVDPFVAMTVAAEATKRLRVATLVACNDFRHPVVLHKMSASLDVTSGGRLELGIGAGWLEDEYMRTGLKFDPAPVRIRRLAESVSVVKALFAGRSFDFEGEFYRCAGLLGGPMTLQRPRPPILIGGGGKVVLRLAAREADIVGLNAWLPAGVWDDSADRDLSPSRTDAKVKWISDELDRVGRPRSEVVLQTTIFEVYRVRSKPHRRRILDELASKWGVPPEEVTHVPQVLVGDDDEWDEELRWRRDRWGLSYFVLPRPTSTASLVARLTNS